MQYGDFDKFIFKYIIEFDIIVETPLSIKSGGAFIGPIDNPIVRIRTDKGDIPYIPGSSLKGVLRSEAERYVRTTMPNEFVCDILNPDYNHGELRIKREIEERKRKGENVEYEPCIICQIFGGPTIASHVYVYDAYPIDDSYSITVMRRVSISRVTGAQMPGRLFDVEFVNLGSKFRGMIVVENLDILSTNDKRARVFNYAFKIFSKGMIPIGGMKSVGMGRVKVDNIKVTKIFIEDGKLTEEDISSEYKKILESL